MDKTKWYEKAPGNTSSGRILILIGGFTGLLLIVSGAVATFLGIGDSTVMLTVGFSMYAAAIGGKSYMTKQESLK